jgi:hypothetical protein
MQKYYLQGASNEKDNLKDKNWNGGKENKLMRENVCI